MFFFLYRNRSRLQKENFEKKYGTMYENLLISKIPEIRGINKTPIFYTSLFLLRRLLLGFCAYWSEEFALLTVIIYTISSLFTLGHALSKKNIYAS